MSAAKMRKKAQINKATAKHSLDYATELYMNLFAYTLHIELGFHKKRVKRILDRLDEQFKCVQSGNLEFDDIKKFVKEELGITVNL